ncbi:hypothetical protein D3C87_1404380 [compost metagenome]
MRRHGAGHGVQLLEVLNPEVFVDVDVAVVALRGAAVGTEEAQFSPWLAVFAQHDRVAGQLKAKPFLGKRDDVAAENLGLGAAGGQENLVVTGQHRIHERFAGEVVGQAHLATLQDVADSRRQRVLFGGKQLLLVAVHFADELVEEVCLSQVADVVLDLLFPFLSTCTAPIATLTAIVALIVTTLAIVFLRFAGRNWSRLRALLCQALADGGQAIQLVQFALGQGGLFFQ